MTTRPDGGIMGTLYLLHFSGRLGTTGRNSAMHYLGWADDLDARIADHRAGRGAHITAAAVAAGFQLEVVWTRPGTRDDERRLKRAGHHAERRCVVCRAGAVVEPIRGIEAIQTILDETLEFPGHMTDT